MVIIIDFYILFSIHIYYFFINIFLIISIIRLKRTILIAIIDISSLPLLNLLPMPVYKKCAVLCPNCHRSPLFPKRPDGSLLFAVDKAMDCRHLFDALPPPLGLQITVFYGQPFQEIVNVYQWRKSTLSG